MFVISIAKTDIFCYNFGMEINFNLQKLNNKRVGVAVSGGADSMALLHFLTEKAPLFNFTVLAINIDHCMRGEESACDSKFVKDYCDKIGVPVILFNANDDGEILSGEESARNYRYSCFKKVIDNGYCDLIATAHHKSDFVETALINLFRGSSPSGLTGIKEQSDYIIRPLIYTDKEQIDAYVRGQNLPFVVDSTNLETDYARNFLRLKVLPLIKEKFPQAENNVQKFATLLALDDEYLNSLATALVSKDGNAIKVSFSAEKTILARAFVIALKMAGIKKDYEKKHVDMLCDLFFNGETGSEVSLIFGVTAVKEYDFITLYKKEQQTFTPCPVKEGEYSFCDCHLTIKKVDVTKITDLKDEVVKYIDADKLPTTAVIRTRLDGDKFKTFSGNGKKLKDYLIDFLHH